MRVVWLALLLVLVGCGKTPQLSKLPADAVVLAFGDSLTFGTGASPEESYPVVLEKLIGRHVESAGVPGEVTAEGLQRLPDVLEETKPKLMLLCHGGNDLLRKSGEAQAAANLRSMVSLAKSKGIEVVLIAVPKPGLMLSPPEYYEKIAAEFKLPIEAAVLRSIIASPDLKSDTIHPNAAGYKKMADAIASLLKQAKAI
ncbi:MAG: arylesterase [Burkholderiales bacterium]